MMGALLTAFVFSILLAVLGVKIINKTENAKDLFVALVGPTCGMSLLVLGAGGALFSGIMLVTQAIALFVL